MRDKPGGEATEAEIEISLSREDMLMLSTGRSFDRQKKLKTADGIEVALTVTLRGQSAE